MKISVIDPPPRAPSSPIELGLSPAETAVRAGLEAASGRLAARGVRVPDLNGKLLRPLVAYALVPREARSDLDLTFWYGALAVQMVHEASLLHDDILDAAPNRRGEDTMQATEGIGRALLLGDLYLTGAYCAAADSERRLFLGCFVEAVERTVSGEAAQGRAAGRRLTYSEYEAVIRGKSGALFAAAATLGAFTQRDPVMGHPDHPLPSGPSQERLEAHREFGLRMGAMYQRIDDLLDYLPDVPTGKPPLQDHRQRKWTWVMDLLGADDFRTGPEELARRLFEPVHRGPAPAEQALGRLVADRDDLVRRAAALAPGDEIVAQLLDGWIATVERALTSQGAASRPGESLRAVEDSRQTSDPVPGLQGARTAVDQVREAASALGGPEDWPAYFGRYARTFSLAARFFPREAATTVTGIYAYCRFTDDLVDESAPERGRESTAALLEAWRELTVAAWSGEETRVPLLDQVVAPSAAAGVDLRYPTALIDGVAMDLDPRLYRNWDALEVYTFRVAGAVGGWLTQRLGIHDRDLLERAHALGHAMQITNIARDVGEDLRRGRLYLPLELLETHGLDRVDLERLSRAGGPPPDEYRAVIEALLARADELYALAWPAIRALPGWYRRPVAVAASAYRGIHDEIRRNAYDNLTRRARTSGARKLTLAATGLLRTAVPASPPGRLLGRPDRFGAHLEEVPE